jgi:IS5 family transposase
MKQLEIVSLEQLVSESHRYRKFKAIWEFKEVDRKLRLTVQDNPHEGYGITKLFKCLLLQFLEDLSDRELEIFLQENNAGKWFCGFGLSEATPDHTVFTRARKKIGTNLLSKLFEDLKNQLKRQGYMNEVFTFVDASHLISKATLWEERDKAIKEKYEQLNNEVLPKVANDKQARIGCKGKNKFWYGYKKHVSVDMQSGLINKVAVTPANVTDAKGLKHVCPSQGAIYADKGYCVSPAKQTAISKGCHLAAIKKNNMKDKNPDKDRWYSKLRAPYERVFSQANKRVRYKGIAKNQFAEFMNAICFNLKRLVVLGPPLKPALYG